LWGLSRGEAGRIGTVTLLISSLGGRFSGTLADKFGRVKMLQITILWYSFFIFLCAFGWDPFMTELYPTEIHGTRQSFCYNAGRAAGSLFPTMVRYLSQVQALGISIAICSATTFRLMIVMLLLLPERRGRSLATLETAATGDRSLSHAYSRN